MAAGDVALQEVETTVDSGTIDTVTITPTASHHITGVFVKWMAPEVTLIGVSIPTDPATSAVAQFKVSGPGGSTTYPVVLTVTEIDST